MLDILKNRYELQPEQMQFTTSIIACPFVLKMFYGIFTEAFPICGSTKKSYIILIGIAHLSVLAPCFLFKFESVQVFVFFTTAQIFCSGVLDVVIDGLIVVQARLDPKNGAQDLQVFVFTFWSIAGMIGFVIGGLLTQHGMANYCFLIMVISTFLVDVAACFLDSRLESDQKDLIE